jgi:hypothetical protein
MRRGTITLLLVCCDLGLLAVLGYLWKARHPSSVSTAPLRDAVDLTIHTTNATAAPEPAQPVTTTEARVTWRMIAARDYKLYVANLRALGCPELTIQDIIIAAVNRDFAPRETALKARPQDLPFWEGQLPASDKAWAMRQQLRELLRQKRALLEELLGISVPIEFPYVLDNERFATVDEALLKLPQHKREAVRAIQEKFWDESERTEQYDRALWEPEELEALKKARRDYWDALAKVLTPDEVVDYDLTRSTTARSMRNELGAFEPTEQEFREMFKVRRALEAQANEPGAPDYNGSIPDELVKSALGEQRYAEYKRARDPAFQDIYRAAQRAGHTREAAVQAHEIHKVTMQEQISIMRDPNLSNEQKAAQRQAVQAQASAAVQQIFGPVTVRFSSGGTLRIEAPQKQ